MVLKKGELISTTFAKYGTGWVQQSWLLQETDGRITLGSFQEIFIKRIIFKGMVQKNYQQQCSTQELATVGSGTSPQSKKECVWGAGEMYGFWNPKTLRASGEHHLTMVEIAGTQTAL